jgi:hypothetical protein
LIVIALLNATARAAMAAWTYYQFKDVAQETIVFGYGATTGQLHDQILRRGQDLEVPIEPEDLVVTRDGARTLAEATYTQPVELFPRYTYPFTFSFEVDAIAVNPPTHTEAPNPQ